jgi:hypothetical protein
MAPGKNHLRQRCRSNISTKGNRQPECNGVHHRNLAPEDALFAGHEQASHSGVPERNQTKHAL